MKLIFHIGAGKTGSTSIQSTLRENDKILKEQGVWYLGLMLERVETKHYDWQITSSVVPEFHHMPEEEASNQVLEVLRPIIEEAKATNIHTLIWSNESFLGGKHNFMSALKKLKEEGVKIELLIYVREYASWMRSAYIQWGIKHKTYKGKLQTFTQWSPNHIPAFYHQMKNLLDQMPEEVYVRNMSVLKDVVTDFLTFGNIDTNKIQIFRDNESPKGEELFLRALFNSKYPPQVLPSRFDNIMGNGLSFSKTPQNYLEELLPNTEDLNNIITHSVEDQEALNILLLSQDQEALKTVNASPKSMPIDNEKLLMSLADIIMQQSRRIDRLERLIEDLKGRK